MTLEQGCRNVVSMSSDCRGVFVYYPAGINLSPEPGCSLRLETGFVSFFGRSLNDARWTTDPFSFPCVDDGRKVWLCSSFRLIIVTYECPLQLPYLRMGLQLTSFFMTINPRIICSIRLYNSLAYKMPGNKRAMTPLSLNSFRFCFM